MSFQPILPGGGLTGWRMLQRTLPVQQAAHRQAPAQLRDTQAFAARIASVRSAADLVADRQLLSVALGAFGLGEDIDNRFLVRRILEEGSAAPDALANRMADDRYKALAKTFGFGDLGGARTALPGFAEDIVARYEAQSFEIAVGAQDDSLRQALYASRMLPEMASEGASADTLWLRVMGTPPLRRIFETALGLPADFGKLDLDRQIADFRGKTAALMGDGEIAQFAQPDAVDKLVDRFLLREQAAAVNVASAGQMALTLLQSMPRLPKPALY